jgi:hypothetical protein
MVHRLHKAVVPHTNKKNIIHDLMEYQQELHGLRFALEAELEDSHNLNRNDGFCELLRLGLLDSSYFESPADLLARGIDLGTQIETDFLGGSLHILKATCHGHRQQATLSNAQLIELYKAYEPLGIKSMQTNHRVSYYDKVHYIIRDQPTTENEDTLDRNSGVCEMRKIKIKADDVIEFLDPSPDSFYGRGFGRIISVMVHERMVFLVITWIIPTGQTHPQLPLHEFKEVPLFHYAAFHPLTIVDHPRFVNRVYFAKLDGKLYLNDWVFDIV